MKRVIALVFVSLALLLPATAPAAPEAYQGVVNHVYDPATIRIGYKGGQIRVKLADLRPPYAVNGRETLSRMLLGKKVSVKPVRWEKGFLIGRVFAEGRCVRDELTKAAGINATDASENEAAVPPSPEEV